MACWNSAGFVDCGFVALFVGLFVLNQLDGEKRGGGGAGGG